jgi:hypothetical protein
MEHLWIAGISLFFTASDFAVLYMNGRLREGFSALFYSSLCPRYLSVPKNITIILKVKATCH